MRIGRGWQSRRHCPLIVDPAIPATCARCQQDALAPIHRPPRGLREGLLDLFGLLGPPRPDRPSSFTAVVMTCGRCNQPTGNNTQGHYWAFCKVTRTFREHHFCCPGDCELEASS